MILERIAISGLRNIHHLDFCPHPSINWLTGLNGAGKTSILEAMFLISRGRGYRGRKHGPLLGAGRDFLEVSALLRSLEDDGPLTRLKLTRAHDESHFQENGQAVSGVQHLRRRFHVRLIADNSQQLLEGQPGLRRLFLDWNLFHVEPGYGRILAEFRRVLVQRNSWLRSGARGPAVWDPDYCRLAESITRSRREFLTDLDGLLSASAVEGLGLCPVLEFRPGWPAKFKLMNILAESLKDDRDRGFTYYGPPRADFLVLSQDRKSLPSRGQTKFLVFLLQLAAQRHWLNKGGPPCIWLLDDIGAELDSHALASILQAIALMPGQAFITAVACHGEVPKGYASGAVFHVERGAIIG